MATRAEPAYRAIARELRDGIRRGDYADGRPMPTEADLATAHRVSRQTIRRAFQDLVADGLVVRVPGRGTFARDHAAGYIRHVGSVDDLMALSDDTRMRVLEPLARRVDVHGAGRLHLPTDVVYRMSFTRSHADTPFCVTAVVLPPEIGVRLLGIGELGVAGAESEATVIGMLEARLGVAIVEARQSITAASADASHAAGLGCAPGSPLLRVDRLYLGSDGVPVELAVSHFLPEHYSYRITLRRT